MAQSVDPTQPRDVDPVRVMRPRFADSIRASSRIDFGFDRGELALFAGYNGRHAFGAGPVCEPMLTEDVEWVRSIRRNILAGLLCKFLKCSNDLSGALAN